MGPHFYIFLGKWKIGALNYWIVSANIHWSQRSVKNCVCTILTSYKVTIWYDHFYSSKLLWTLVGCLFYPSVLFLHCAMLKNERSANHMPPRWYWMVEQNLTIQFCLHNSIKFDKIPNTAGWNVTPDHDRASTMFCRWLQTLTVVAVSWNTHNIHLWVANIHLKQKFQMFPHFKAAVALP